MTAPTTTEPTQAPAEQVEDRAAARDLQIDTDATKMYQALKQAEQNKPPEQRIADRTLWTQARRQATRDYRKKAAKARAKQVGKDVATSVYAESKSVVHRNRAQLAPWLLTTPYAATGEAAWLLAEYGSGVPVGISAVCAATTAGASILAWRKKLAKRVPGRFQQKVQAGLGMLCGWTSMMPLVDNQAGMWLGLAAGTSYMGLSWWRDQDHPIPTDLATQGDSQASSSEAPAARSETDTSADELFVRQVIADWQKFVVGMGTLPGSQLDNPRRTEYGWQFSLHLNRGKQRLETARAALPDIAAALDVEVDDLSIDRDTRPGATKTTLVLTITTEEITNAYDGPRIIRSGGDIFIDVGPYEDGIGSTAFHVLADQLTDDELAEGQRPRGSMNGGFVLGTKGSGKSRLMELVAVGLRQLGIEIWYLDPQGGKSSPALMAEADWPLAGMHGTDGAYSNVIDLWKAVKAACEVREAEGGTTEQGFQHTRQRPSIMVMIDECHGVFQAENPETGNSFGEDFAELDRVMRKNGIGLFGASQAITQDTFGRGNKSAVLRDGMCAVNVFLMAYGGKNLKLAPGYDDQPCGMLPLNRGFGYNPKGERPHTRWQARYTHDFQPWLAAYPRATLDARVQKRIGTTYTRRFEKAEKNEVAKQSWLADLDAAEDASELPSLGQQTRSSTTTSKSPQGGGGTVTALLSPSQRRQQAAAPEQSSVPDRSPSPLTTAEQRALDLLEQEPGHTPTSLGQAQGITSQVAGKRLRSLAAKGYATKRQDGSYTP